MDFLNGIPDGIWQLPLPTLMLALLATGVLVTRREHTNMTSMMEYFRDLNTKKDETISTQAKTIHAYKEAALTTKKVVDSIHEVVSENKGEPNVSS